MMRRLEAESAEFKDRNENKIVSIFLGNPVIRRFSASVVSIDATYKFEVLP